MGGVWARNSPAIHPDCCVCARTPPACAGSDVVGKTIREAAFRGRFHAAVVAIKRDGEAHPCSSAGLCCLPPRGAGVRQGGRVARTAHVAAACSRELLLAAH